LFNLTSALTRTEDLLRRIVTELEDKLLEPSGPRCTLNLPPYESWIVTMWHFNRDSKKEYTGEKFSITIEDAMDVMIRVYTKEIDAKTRIRIEKQEYPQRTLIQAIEERLATDS